MRRRNPISVISAAIEVYLMAKTYRMRRADKEIKDKKKLAKILMETNFVTLALAKDNEP